jgi:hypothetical protein
MQLRIHSAGKVILALAVLVALGIASGCNKSSPTAPKAQGVAGVSDSPGNYFVDATSGDDANSGSQTSPFQSIQKAIDVAAVGNTQADIYVAYGTYAGSIVLRSRMNLHGGYSPSTWVRSLTADSTVVSGGPTAITGSDADSLSIDGFTIRSADATAAGGASIGIHLKGGSQGVRIAENRIFAGQGKVGSSGSWGLDGLDVTGSGSKGVDGGGCPNDGGGGQGSTIGSKGGGGGNGSLFNGGTGGGGSGPGGGGGGAGGVVGLTSSSPADHGADGNPGSTGGNGTKGSSFGAFSSGSYVPAAGLVGGNGGNGGGGGGGGAGAGTGLICGPGGGGGGAGGGGGKGGGGGAGGGGSFGVLLVQGSTGALENNVIVANNGGNGGVGARGGFGGTSGGSGARGAVGTDFLGARTSTAGIGGEGGGGGNGGYGGGGGGGPSIGILEDTASTFTRAGNQVSVGSAGTGGFSSGNPGDNGETDLFRKL